MTPEQIERVFGCSRLKMATGEHVEVFREAVRAGERRRYTKRFLETGDADFRQWTEREWRILARLIGHGIRCVPDVVKFDGGAEGGVRQVQTYDAGVTVDQWAMLLPVARGGAVLRHVFEDCAHWWALAHHCLAALEEIHALQLVHLDIKADNICIPFAPTDFDPDASGVRLRATFTNLALIDFAFSVVSREMLATPLPIGWQKDYDYQSPRLLVALESGRAGNLQPTQDLDWRCDFYSLAAMLRRYLPDETQTAVDGGQRGWTAKRYDSARTLIFRLRDCHDGAFSIWRPHRGLMEVTGSHLAETDLAASLAEGWTLARDVEIAAAPSLVTPLTRIAAPLQTTDVTPASLVTAATIVVPAVLRTPRARGMQEIPSLGRVAEHARPRREAARSAMLGLAAGVALACPAYVGDPLHPFADQAREAFADLRSRFNAEPKPAVAPMATADSPSAAPAPAPTTPAGAAEAPEPPSGAANSKADDARASDVGAPAATGTAESETPAAPAALAASGGSPAVAEAPAARTKADSSSPTTKSRNSSKARGKPAEPAKRAPAAAHPPQVARAGPPAVDPNRSRAATEAQKPRHDVASSNVSPSRSLRPAPVPVARPVSTTQLAAAPEPAPAPKAAMRIDAPPVEALPDERAATSAAPGAPPSAQPGALANPPGGPDSRPERADVATPRIVAPSSATPHRHNAFEKAVQDVLKALGVREQQAAPIEDRNPRASPSVAEAARPPVRVAQSSVMAPEAKVREPELPSPTWLPMTPSPVTTSPATPSPAMPSPIAPSPVAASPVVASTPTVINPAPRALPPARMLASASTADETDDALGMRARWMLSESVPRVAAQARADASTVLWMAAAAEDPAQSTGVVNAAHGPWNSEQFYLPGSRDPVRARRLYEEAKWANSAGRRAEALDLGLRAFASDPRDPNIAGFLATLHLNAHPPQPETARQLALHALAVSGSRRGMRATDWNTLAIASALTGREVDATQALLVELAVTPDLDRSCDTVQRAYGTFGEPLRVPAQAMLARIRAQRRDYVSPNCAWLNYQVYQMARRWQ